MAEPGTDDAKPAFSLKSNKLDSIAAQLELEEVHKPYGFSVTLIRER